MTPTATITATEFKRNFGKYLRLVEFQDFNVTRNGKTVGIWTNPEKDRKAMVEELAGSVHATIDAKADKDDRISRK